MDRIQTSAEAPASGAQHARIWPAWIVVGLQIVILIISVTPSINNFVRFAAMMGGPLICFVLFGVWLLFASRTRWWERLGVLCVIGLGGAAVAMMSAEQTGIAFWIYGIPACMFLTGVAFTYARDWIPSRRFGITSVLLLGVWASLGALRLEGFNGAYHPSFRLRWTPTAEARLALASSKQRDSSSGEAATAWSATTIEWPQFRGAFGNGQVEWSAGRMDWNEQPPREVWRIAVGPAWSSMSLVSGRLFTQEQRGELEIVSCYDADTGTLIWHHDYDNRFSDVVSGAGPRATPTFDKGRIFAFGAKAVLLSLDAASGEQLWHRDLMNEVNAQLPVWGFSGSPMVIDNSVIVYAGGDGDNGLMSFDWESGETLWTLRSTGMNFSSVQRMRFGEQTMIVFTDATGAIGLDPTNGQQLWMYPFPDGTQPPIVQAQQISDDSFVVALGDGIGMARVQVDQEGGQWITDEVWNSSQLKPSFNDYIHSSGNLYGFDNHMLTCLDAISGERAWKLRGYDYGQVLLLEKASQLIVTTEKGDIALIDTSSERPMEMGRVRLLDGKTWNHPIAYGNRIYHRNGKEMVCLEVLPGPDILEERGELDGPQ